MKEVRRVNQTIKGRLITFVVRAAKTSSIKTRSNMPRTGDKVPGSPRKFHFQFVDEQKRLRRAAFSVERQSAFRSPYTCLRNAATVSWAALRVFTT
jgi:hypothetical protein